MYPSKFATERTQQHPKRNKTHIKVPDVEQMSPRQFFFLYRGATSLVGQSLLIIEVSRLHSDTPHSVGLL